MKFYFIIMSFFVFLNNCLSADWAESRLDNSKRNFEIKFNDISNQRNEILKRIDILNSQIELADKKLKTLNNTKSEYDILGAKSTYYNKLAKDLASDVSLFFNVDIDSRNLSLAEAENYLKKNLSNYLDSILNPSAFEDCVAKQFKTNETLYGKSFRIGAFRYFVNDNTAGLLTDDNKLYMENLSVEIKAFLCGESSEIPADISGTALYIKLAKQRSIIESINAGGVWVYPIIFFGVFSLLVFILKFFTIILIGRPSAKVVDDLDGLLKANKVDEAMNIAKSLKYPYNQLVKSLIESKGLNSSIAEEIAYEQMLSVGQKLFSWLSVLSVTAGIAPLLGLLGTVTGIIKTFADLSTKSAQQAMSISEGISEALITTEYGLIVAIPTFIAHAILSRRAKAIMSEMEKLSSKFLSNYK